MFLNSNCELITTTKKDVDGISFEFFYKMNLSAAEIEKLKHFRENFGKTSPIHFNFSENKFSFSQIKYLKKSQYVENPPNLGQMENNFLEEIKLTLNKFQNLLRYENTENSEKTRAVDISEVLKLGAQ